MGKSQRYLSQLCSLKGDPGSHEAPRRTDDAGITALCVDDPQQACSIYAPCTSHQTACVKTPATISSKCYVYVFYFCFFK